MFRGRGLAAVACVAGASVLLALAPAAEASVVKRKRVAEGVVYKRVVRRGKKQDYHVVSVALAKPSGFQVALSNEALAGLERTSSMARRKGAILAINGDYARPTGRPVMTFAREGVLDQSPLAWGRNFAVDEDQRRAYIGHPSLEVKISADHLKYDRWIPRVNDGGPYGRRLALFTPVSEGLEEIPKGMCSARLDRDSLPTISMDQAAVETTYLVDRVVCRRAPLGRQGGIVLAADRNRRGAEIVSGFQPGDRAVLSWTLGWDGVSETVGGNPTLVERGRIAVKRESHPFFRRNPRTAVGTTRNGRVLLVAVDGRRKKARGMSLLELARLFKELGARFALNLDGGGSTTMWVRGLGVVNRPSDGHERAVSSALLLTPGGGRPKTSSSKAPPPTTSGDWRAAVTDPASTGGMASALQDRGVTLPGSLAGAARTFAATLRGPSRSAP